LIESVAADFDPGVRALIRRPCVAYDLVMVIRTTRKSQQQQRRIQAVVARARLQFVA
jgi:hypothetical protein